MEFQVLFSRQCKEEAAAEALMRLDPDASPVHLDDMFTDTEAVPRASIFIHAVELAKWFKYDCVVFRIYAYAIVFDTEAPVFAIAH